MYSWIKRFSKAFHFVPSVAQKCSNTLLERFHLWTTEGTFMIKFTQEDFIKKATEVHNGRYDYSLTIFTYARNKVK